MDTEKEKQLREHLSTQKIKDLKEILSNNFPTAAAISSSITGSSQKQLGKKQSLIETIVDLSKNTKNDDQNDNTFDIILDNLEMQNDKSQTLPQDFYESDEISQKEERAFIPSDPEWTNYVLGQLTNDEKIKDINNTAKEYPTTDGLRRLVEKLVGCITQSKTKIHQVPCPENEKRATVSVIVAIIAEQPPYREYEPLEFSGAADVYYNNSTIPFSNHPVATAETKAEGRAYKKALKIKVSTFEEVENIQRNFENSSLNNYDGTPIDGLIKQDQINFIDIICSRLDINVKKIIEKVLPNSPVTPKEIPYDKACDILTLLQKYQDKEEEIEKETEGYDPNWV